MKKLGFTLVAVFSGTMFVSAQQPMPLKTPDAAAENRRMMRQREESNRRFDTLRISGGNTRYNNLRRTDVIQTISNLYRKPTKSESELLAPDKEDLKQYAQLLRQPNSGLQKLIADNDCDENTNILNASDNCLKYSMPGGGSSYSFRIQNYRIRRLADLTYTDNSFQSLGVFAHSILVNVGDIPFDQISLQTKGLEFLNDFQTISDFDKAKEIDRQINDGFEKDGFVYRRGLSAQANTTYILRSIAYRGSYYRTLDGFVYDELYFDKRMDVTVAFRIVRRDEEGITIIWKKLLEKDSPKVKRKNNQD